MEASAAQGQMKKTVEAGCDSFAAVSLSQMGNMWPRTAKSAATASAVRRHDRHQAKRDSRQARQPPLSTSRMKVAMPRPRAPLRMTLVAPMLPLPMERTILFAEDAHQQVAKGNGPQQIRYRRDGSRKNHNDRV